MDGFVGCASWPGIWLDNITRDLLAPDSRALHRRAVGHRPHLHPPSSIKLSRIAAPMTNSPQSGG